MRAWPVLAFVAGCGRLDFATVVPDAQTADCVSAPACLDDAFGVPVFSVRSSFAFHGVDVQTDGKYVFAGIGGIPSVPTFVVGRVTDDGVLDPTFGDAGLSEVPGGIEGISVTAFGQGLAVSGIAASGFGCFAAALDEQGELLTEYAGTGYVTSTFDAMSSTACNGVQFSGGHMFAGGQGSFSPTGFDLIAGHWDASGSLWASEYQRPYPAIRDQFGGLAGFAPDGNLGLIADSFDGSTWNGLIIRASSADGSLLPNFAGGAALLEDRGGDEHFLSMTHDATNRIVAAGYRTPGGDTGRDLFLARYANDGAPDVSFGDAGAVIIDLGGEDIAKGVVALPDGRIVIGASSSGTSSVVVLSPTGEKLGQTMLPISGTPNWIARDPQGRIVVFGDTENGAKVYLARVLIAPP